MRPWFAQSLGDFRRQSPAEIAARLAYAQADRFGALELKQRDSWEQSAALLRDALAEGDSNWHIFMECDLLRLKNRAVRQQNGIRAFFQAEQIAFHEDVPGIIATGQGVLQQRRALFPGIALLHFKRGEAVYVFVSQ